MSSPTTELSTVNGDPVGIPTEPGLYQVTWSNGQLSSTNPWQIHEDGRISNAITPAGFNENTTMRDVLQAAVWVPVPHADPHPAAVTDEGAVDFLTRSHHAEVGRLQAELLARTDELRRYKERVRDELIEAADRNNTNLENLNETLEVLGLEPFAPEIEVEFQVLAERRVKIVLPSSDGRTPDELPGDQMLVHINLALADQETLWEPVTWEPVPVKHSDFS